MNYAYLIYQIKDMKTDYAFMGWNFAKDRINLMDYDGVYYGRSIDGENPIAVLENLYEMFNINHPLDFNGHSLSMSDIVVLFDDNGCRWYYCDSFGWRDITADLRERR